MIAGDGSTVGLPPSRQIKVFFGIYSEKGGGIKSCMAQIFMFYDVFSGAILSKRISKMENTERTLFNACLEELPTCKSIVILDRGFGYFHILKKTLHIKTGFLYSDKQCSVQFCKTVSSGTRK